MDYLPYTVLTVACIKSFILSKILENNYNSSNTDDKNQARGYYVICAGVNKWWGWDSNSGGVSALGWSGGWGTSLTSNILIAQLQ